MGPRARVPKSAVRGIHFARYELFITGTYCGQQRSLEVFSSAETLFVRFRTLKRQADSQNRGFAGWFEFSEKFAKLGENYTAIRV